MAFLGALTALGGGLEEAEKTQIAQQSKSLDALLKQEMLQLRSLQMGNALNKQQNATSDAAIEGDVWPAMFGSGGGGASNPEDTGFIPPVPPPPPPTMPTAGPQAGAGAPPGQPAPGQPGAQMPPQGPPQGQMAQMRNMPGQQQQLPPGTQPPGPDGRPSFAQQGMVQVPQMQPQQQAVRGPAYASLQPQQPQPGPPSQPQPQGQQVAQAQPQPQRQQQRPQQRQFSPERLEAVIKQRHPNLTPEQFNRVFKDMLGKVEGIERLKGAEESRAATAESRKATEQHRKFEEQEQLKRDEARAEAEKAKKEEKESYEKDMDTVVEGIKTNKLPPTVTGRYGKDKTKLDARLVRAGVDLGEKQNQWLAAQLDIKAMNAPRARAVFGYARAVQSTLKRSLAAADKLNLSRFKDFNQLQLLVEGKGVATDEERAAIRTYLTDINTLKAEFAQLENAGYAPTEHVWELAKNQINENWGVKDLTASLKEIRELIDIRVNAFRHPLGADTSNPYMRQEQERPEQPAQQGAPAGADPLGWK